MYFKYSLHLIWLLDSVQTTVKTHRWLCSCFCDLHIKRFKFSDVPRAAVWFWTGNLIQFFFPAGMKVKGRSIRITMGTYPDQFEVLQKHMVGWLRVILLNWPVCSKLLHVTMYAKFLALFFSCHFPLSYFLSPISSILFAGEDYKSAHSFSYFLFSPSNWLYMLLSRHSPLRMFSNRKRKQ